MAARVVLAKLPSGIEGEISGSLPYLMNTMLSPILEQFAVAAAQFETSLAPSAFPEKTVAKRISNEQAHIAALLALFREYTVLTPKSLRRLLTARGVLVIHKDQTHEALINLAVITHFYVGNPEELERIAQSWQRKQDGSLGLFIDIPLG